MSSNYLYHTPTPVPGSEEERQMFQHLQNQFVDQFKHAFPNKLASKTVVIIPSLTLDQDILQKIHGIVHYEERMLCMLLLLRMPRTQVIFVSSVPMDPVVVDYYLHLLPGITSYHARQRLTMLSCFDASHMALTQKILERPRLIERIRKLIPPGQPSHMSCFNVTTLERTLALQLNMPIYGCDPDLFELGNKSNGRKLFQQCGLTIPDGFEDLSSESDIAEALTAIKLRNPQINRAVLKINEGFSGEGNALFSFPTDLEQHHIEPQRILELLPKNLSIIAKDLKFEQYIKKFVRMGGIAEVFLEGTEKASPSVQCRINPLGICDIISTHDQVLGGDGGQVFQGAYFPAHKDYASDLAKLAMPVGNALRDKGVIGRFGIDFMSVKDEAGVWQHYAIEINLRKGGTTHPYLMLNFLTDGQYNAKKGRYLIRTGQERFYFSTDNLVDASYKGLTPHDLIEIAMDNDLMFNGASQEGVMFHIIGALSQYGKLGVLSIGKTPEKARGYYERTKEVLSMNCR